GVPAPVAWPLSLCLAWALAANPSPGQREGATPRGRGLEGGPRDQRRGCIRSENKCVCVVCCGVLCCVVVWCVVLCCGVLWCGVVWCGVLWRVVLCCVVLCWMVRGAV